MKTWIRKGTALLLALLMTLSICSAASFVSLPETQVRAETTSGDFTYELIDEGMVEITDYSGSATNLTIPETLDGNTVLSIGDYAFNFQDQLTQVTIPDTVMYIGESAFSDCGLTSVTIPDSVIEIGSYAFRFCDNLTEITIPDTVLVIGQGILDSTPFAQDASHYKNNALYAGNHLLSVDKDVISGEYDVAPGTRSIAMFAFSEIYDLTKVVMPDTVLGLGYGAFWDCYNLSEVEFSDNLLVIEYAAFEACWNLEVNSIPDSVIYLGVAAFHDCELAPSFRISENVVYIGDSAFSNSETLKELVVDPANPAYTSVDGVLFTKDMTQLLCYPAGKTGTMYRIPDQVTTIGDLAFRGNQNLIGVIAPATVTTFGLGYYSVFDNCDNLTVYGYAGSAAQAHTNEYGTPFLTLNNATGLPFADVAASGVYYTNAVQYVFQNGLMTGMNATTFGPSQTLSRAQFAVILYRMAGSPSVAGMANPFADNQQASFYRDAVIWCNNAGIITGYFNADGSFTGRFGPSDLITREQLATMLYRYANYAGMDTSASISLDDFGDSNRVSSFAADALQWAAAEGIVSGRQTTPPTIAPQDNASRADTAVMLQRFLA